jgi:transposase-like protein
MTTYTSIRDQFCPNVACSFFGAMLKGNIWVHSRKDARLKCKECSTTWVSHRQEPSYRLRVEQELFSRARALLESGMSVRRTARYVGVSPSTVQRWKGRIVQPTFVSTTISELLAV